jgi:TPR repeat protein
MTDQSPDNDISELIKNANCGDIGSILSLAKVYAGERKGQPANQRLAAKYFLKGAEAGNVEAMMAIAKMFLLGKGVMQDSEESINWYRKAAELENIEAQFSLAEMYRLGRSMPKDVEKAIYWYGKAAAKNHLESQVRLHQLEEYSP